MDVHEEDSIRSKMVAQLDRLASSLGDEDFGEVLANLSALLVSAHYREIRDVAKQLDLSALFHQFNTVSDDRFTDQLMSVFSMFLEALPISDVFVTYFDSVLEGLRSNNIRIVELWIKRIVKTIFTNDGLLKTIASGPVNVVPLLRCTIPLLTSDSTLVASSAHDICVSASKTFRQEFFSPAILDELKRVKDFRDPQSKVDRDTVKVRYCELCVDICCVNQLLLDMVKATGILTEIVTEFESQLFDDPLVAVNMIKLMTDLASQQHGLEFIKRSTTVLPSIAKRIVEINEEDLFCTLLMPALINFFIRIADFDLNTLNEYPVVVTKLFD